jgi:hypothetical protein
MAANNPPRIKPIVHVLHLGEHRRAQRRLNTNKQKEITSMEKKPEKFKFDLPRKLKLNETKNQ